MAEKVVKDTAAYYLALELIEKVAELAKKERRSKSQMVAVLLDQAPF